MIEYRQRLMRPWLDDNPVTVQILGLCSALAVSNSLRPALIMSVSVIAVLIFSNVAISALRHILPRSIRLVLEVTLIASAVIVVDELLKAYAPETSQILSVFVGLIITNCIILGRAESFALHNSVLESLADGVGNGLGYATILIVVAMTRELLGSGTLLDVAVFADSYPRNELMLYAPSAFFIIGLIIWTIRTLRPQQIESLLPARDSVNASEIV